VVYQSKLVPVAVNAVATAPWQYEIGVTTIGAAGNGFIITSICALTLSHPLFISLT
jgi:hypothetical protein